MAISIPKKPKLSKTEFEKAMSINPSDAFVMANYGMLLIAYGDWDNAYIYAQKAIEFSPHQPGWFPFVTSFYHYRKKDYDHALIQAQYLEMPIIFWRPLIQAAIYGQIGNTAEALPLLERLDDLQPDFKSIGRELMYNQLYSNENVNMLLEGLHKAGMEKLE